MVELTDVNVALDLLSAKLSDLRAELEPLADPTRILNKTERARLFDLRLVVGQITRGLALGEGTLPEVDALMRRPEVAQFRLAMPGIESLTRLRDRLLAEQAATPDTGTWPRKFRLRTDVRMTNVKGKPDGDPVRPKVRFGDRFVVPGEVVELNQSQASAWKDLFEPV